MIILRLRPTVANGTSDPVGGNSVGLEQIAPLWLSIAHVPYTLTLALGCLYDYVLFQEIILVQGRSASLMMNKIVRRIALEVAGQDIQKTCCLAAGVWYAAVLRTAGLGHCVCWRHLLAIIWASPWFRIGRLRRMLRSGCLVAFNEVRTQMRTWLPWMLQVAQTSGRRLACTIPKQDSDSVRSKQGSSFAKFEQLLDRCNKIAREGEQSLCKTSNTFLNYFYASFVRLNNYCVNKCDSWTTLSTMNFAYIWRILKMHFEKLVKKQDMRGTRL